MRGNPKKKSKNITKPENIVFVQKNLGQVRFSFGNIESVTLKYFSHS